jgi:Na+/H+-translocating membrane pyrophosphatase
VLVFTLDMQMYALSLTSGLLGIALAAYFILRITLRPITTPEMVEVAGDIRSGARTYLRRQIKTILFITPSSHCCCIGSWTGRQPSQRSSAC